MSTEEQDLILGRLTRETREAKQRIAALEAKLSNYSKSLNDVSLKLNGTWNPKPKPVTTIDIAIECLAAIPERQQIAETLSELHRERESLREKEEQLSRMG